jgi:FkbM family methyltransferase
MAGRGLLGTLLRFTGADLFPVRVRGGVAEGARWTLYPWSSYWRGGYEPGMQACVLALGGGNIAGWTCWDLGARYGLYSVGLARLVGPTGQVCAFEPNPESHRRLALHARMNRLGWLSTFEAAASSESGFKPLVTDGDIGATTTHLPYDGEELSGSSAPVSVRTLRLDELVDSGEIRPPNFIKMDVEGHGHRALAGMIRAVSLNRPVMIAAFHSPQEAEGISGTLFDLGYSRVQIATDSGCNDPVVGHDFLFTPPVVADQPAKGGAWT